MSISDSFASSVLSPVWTVSGPAGISHALGQNASDAYLELVTPDGDHNVWDTNKGARAMQNQADEDFALETRFLSTPADQYQMQGLLVEQDADNWLRFDTYSDGNNLRAFAAITVDGDSSPAFNVVIPGGNAPYLRVTRAGDQWTFEYSPNGSDWTVAGSFSHALAVTSAGVFAGNTGSATGFTAQVDYFETSGDPIANEDGDLDPPNVAPDAVDDGLATTQDVALAINVASDLLTNDSDDDGDPLNLTGFTQSTNGTVSDNGDGTLTYTPNAGFTGNDSFTYTITDGTEADTATVSLEVRNQIDVWYGDTQTFGAPGASQQWVNILGNAYAAGLVSLSYSLNGGPEQTLSIGPDTRRLEEDGDFNIDLDFAVLDGSAVDDVVTIKATYSNGDIHTRDVTIDYENGTTWANDYVVNWSSVTNLQNVTQVVDGDWTITADGVRTTQPGYDRILTFGDQSWDNYEVNLSLTINDINNGTTRDGAGLGFGMLWGGHTNDPISGWQPLTGYNPIVSPFYNTKTDDFILHDHPDWSSPHLDTSPFNFTEGATYNVTVRVEQTDLLNRTYRFKIWEEGNSEPVEWLMEGTDVMSEPLNGSFALIAHHWDITYHDLTFAEIEGDDIIMGTDGADLLVGVDPSVALPGLGERDVLVGNEDADVFIFGDSNGSYYDDGNGSTDGVNDFGYAWDFVSGTDQIQLAGTSADYALTEDTVGLPEGTAIWLLGSDGDEDELIGVINDVYGLSLTSDDFFFQGDLLA
ncbi:Ig-like domain-containing protein [Ruegeria sp. AU67]|uniref:cadherin-like domain-containing protein n=1 Tax=Ruegeria sp. AU67 TaxID=2108530 RepID=UPI000D69CC1B|nr:Ig-like domain-containing protein [Ruegeria sp. AU67]